MIREYPIDTTEFRKELTELCRKHNMFLGGGFYIYIGEAEEQNESVHYIEDEYGFLCLT